jgi:hypothetical protein
VKQATEGQEADAAGGNTVENISGFSKTKRDLALKLGVDPYTTNEVFQKELNKEDHAKDPAAHHPLFPVGEDAMDPGSRGPTSD